MNVVELVARTFSPPLQDGRFVFRPWGARGPCYLLSPQQRAFRARIQLAYYCLIPPTLGLVASFGGTTSGIVVVAVAAALLNYVVFWLFSIGLLQTEQPPVPTLKQRRTALIEHSRALGKPLLWVLLIISWLFTFTAGVLALVFHPWLPGLLGLVFFGACAAIFTFQLWLIRGDGKG